MARKDRYGDQELNKKEYKKARKRARKRRRGGCLLKLILLVIILGLIGVAAGAGYAAYTISGAPEINPTTMYNSLNLATYLYDDDGSLMDTIYFDENRKICKYEELPENLKNAFIAIEDKTFWDHHGFNFKRMAGAVLNSITGGGGISGTSTITQQLARNVYLADIKSERSVKRKIIEMYYAYVIENTLSKEKILESYLNTIYLGYGCYGVNSAAKTYFSRELEDLTLAQCAALAALPQAPDSYALIKTENDSGNYTKIRKGVFANDNSRERRELVLDLMAEQGYISQEKADKAKKPLKKFIKPYRAPYATNSRSYFKDYVIQSVTQDMMNQYDLSEQDAVNAIYTDGLKIYTTLDSQAQDVIVKEFKDDSNFPVTVKGEQPEAAMVIVNVETGAIKAMAGGRDPQGEMLFNRATSTRQPGSSIKPLAVYGAALQKSYELQKNGDKWRYTDFGYDSQGTSGYGDYITTSSKIVDEQMLVNGYVWPKNAGGGYSGSNTFRTAIQQSINTCAVKIQLQVGVDYSVDMLESFGITSLITDSSEPYNDLNSASLALGGLTYGVSPLEMALAYATFPNGGVRNKGYCYTKVVDRNGKTILKNSRQEFKVMDPGVAWIMTDTLKSVVTKGIAGDADISGVQSGGKTGTTNDQYDIWFDGFTPNYAASLWIGTDDNVALTTMSGPAAALWGRIMDQVKGAKKGDYVGRPENVSQKNGYYYTKGTEPKDEPKPKPVKKQKAADDVSDDDAADEEE